MTHIHSVSRVFLPILLGFFVGAAPLLAQEATTYVLQPESELTVDGNANTGAWTVTATKIEGNMHLQMIDSTTPDLQKIDITVPTEEIKGRNLIMTRNMRRTLKVGEFKEISYELTEVTDTQVSDGEFTFVTRGNLTIGGVTQDIPMTMTGSIDKEGQVDLKGSYTLLMSDYNLTSRQFGFGQFVLADEVTVHYAVQFVSGK